MPLPMLDRANKANWVVLNFLPWHTHLATCSARVGWSSWAETERKRERRRGGEEKKKGLGGGEQPWKQRWRTPQCSSPNNRLQTPRHPLCTLSPWGSLQEMMAAAAAARAAVQGRGVRVVGAEKDGVRAGGEGLVMKTGGADAFGRGGGGGGGSVTPFMLHNLTKSLGDSNRRALREVEGSAGRSQLEEEVARKGRFEEERVRRESRFEEERARRERVGVAERERRDGVLVCKERAGGMQWNYMNKAGKRDMQVVHAQQHRDPIAELVTFVKSYIVPEGYPESVSPAYTPYMQWRAVQYFFGGAMSVFTTRSLLHALGVSRGNSASSAVAVNWVIKDGAGRIGKMLFARHGKKFDCDLKQLRFQGAMLMQMGAGVELATMVVPHLFLPLACAANVAKNVAAVTSTSTRAPIYKAFARRENIGDVTAKGECISNIADLMGTSLGIFISKKNPSLVTTFCVLSCGYMVSSFNEVKAVRLPTLNRARFGVAVHSFLETGQVPSLEEANRREGVITLPWQEKPLELGSRILQAFANPRDFLKAQEQFQNENYLVTYRPSRRRAHVVIKETASSDDVVRATFQAHVMLHMLRGSKWAVESTSVEAAVAESLKRTRALYDKFKQQAHAKGWMMGESFLNPGDARLCS